MWIHLVPSLVHAIFNIILIFPGSVDQCRHCYWLHNSAEKYIVFMFSVSVIEVLINLFLCKRKSKLISEIWYNSYMSYMFKGWTIFWNNCCFQWLICWTLWKAWNLVIVCIMYSYSKIMVETIAHCYERMGCVPKFH